MRGGNRGIPGWLVAKRWCRGVGAATECWCVACHNMTLNFMFITSELAHVMMSSQEYRLSREKIGQFDKFIVQYSNVGPVLYAVCHIGECTFILSHYLRSVSTIVHSGVLRWLLFGGFGGIQQHPRLQPCAQRITLVKSRYKA